MGAITSPGAATPPVKYRSPPCQLMPQIKTLLIASWFIVPAGGACGLALTLYLAWPMIDVVFIRQPTESAPDSSPAENTPPPAAPPKTKVQLRMRMDLGVDREITEMVGIIEQYSGTFWQARIEED